MGCYPPLITHFNHKIFSKYLGTPHTKCDVMKICQIVTNFCVHRTMEIPIYVQLQEPTNVY